MRKIILFLFVLGFPFVAWAGVLINEVAWMGTEVSTADEWIELYNPGEEDINLTGWTLNAQDGSPEIDLEGIIFAGSYYLLERTNDESVPGVSADLIYSGALSNSGEVLILKNSSVTEIDRVDASEGWPAGDNETKQSMQKSGSGWITAQSTPKAQNVIEESGEEQAQEENESAGTDQWIVDNKNITADAGEDKIAIVGAAVEFEALAYGTQGKPLQTADFLWNFGDGSFKRGRGVFHTYHYPGNYVVMLDASTANYNDSDSLQVKVIPNGLIISEVKPGKDGWVEIYNNSDYDLDISRWRLSNGKFVFYFPKDTQILKKMHLVIPYEISGVEFYSSGTGVLLYPNDKEASGLSYSGFLKNDESFHNIDGVATIGLESPGEERFVARTTNYGPARSVVEESGGAQDELDGPAIFAKEEEKDLNSKLEVEKNESQNVAAASVSQNNKPIFAKTWFWLVLALGLGLFSAIGFLAVKNYFIKAEQTENTQQEAEYDL